MSAQDPDTDRQVEDSFDRQVEEFLRTVPRPSARTEFRERLRQEFLIVAPAPAEVDAPRRREPFRFRWALAAGVLIALGFLLFRSPAPRWQAFEIAADTVVRVDGKIVPTDDRVALASKLQEGEQIHVEKGELVLRVGDVALFGFGPNTRARIRGIEAPKEEPIRLIVDSGRLRARTGPDFRGRSMRVDADLFEATVTGTAFAVDYEDHGTCICCLHGSVTMASKTVPSGPEVIEPNRMCLIYRSEPEREPKRGPHPQHHHDPLERIDGLAQGLWPDR